MTIKYFFLICDFRLAFIDDGIGFGVIIRNAERYDLVKIKPTESVAPWFTIY